MSVLPLARREVVLRCRVGYHGAVVNERCVRLPCHRKRCQRPGQRVFHVWDTLTGRPVRDAYAPSGGALDPAQEASDGRGIR